MSDDLGDNLSKGNDDCSAKGREGEETNETLQDKPFLEDEDIVSPENETTTLGDNTGYVIEYTHVRTNARTHTHTEI